VEGIDSFGGFWVHSVGTRIRGVWSLLSAGFDFPSTVDKSLSH